MLKRKFLAVVIVIGLLLAALAFAFAQDSSRTPEENTKNIPVTGYASVNGLKMYYEIHGTGEPLVVIHGAYYSIISMGEIVPRLAETRQVIAVELQGHGRTADIDRPLSFEQMADDVAALLGEIGVEKAHILGHSMGGTTALQIAIRHPELVDRLVAISATYNSDGWYPEVRATIETITPELFAGSPIEADYKRLAPNPEDFPVLVEKLVQLDTQVQDWSPELIQAITAPTLIIIGDSDSVRPEHAVDLFRLRGGGVDGDLTGLPNAQLAVIPGATHTSILNRVDLLIPIIVEFLDVPIPQ